MAANTRITDLSDYTSVLPYASEHFGVYQPMLGWRSKRTLRRIEREAASTGLALVDRLRERFVGRAELAFNADFQLTGGQIMVGQPAPPITRHTAVLGFAPWSYQTATSPPVVVPDSRTQRGSTSPRTRGGVMLLERDQLRELAGRLAGSRGRPTILVMATPPFVPMTLELAQRLDPIQNDDEGFAGNPTGWARLLDTFLAADARPLLIIAGDVHFGFIARIELERTGPAGTAKMTILQMTASASKNATSSGKAALLQSLFQPDRATEEGVTLPSYANDFDENGVRYRWTAHVSPTVTADANLGTVTLDGTAVRAALVTRRSSGRHMASVLRL